MKLQFFDVDKNYTDYLRNNGDSKIPYIDYKNRNKFLCGIVLTINNMNYYVPVSSNKENFKSSLLIRPDNITTSSLRFSFMFPCPIENITIKDFSKEKDIKYKNLMQKEYEFCNKNLNRIKKKANEIYNLGLIEENRKKFNLCNFPLLEEKYNEWLQLNTEDL